MRTSKIILSGLFLILAGFVLFDNHTALADATGAPAARTGAPSEQTCNVSGCHSGNTLNEASGKLTISGLPGTGYSPSQVVTLTVTLSRAGSARFGFELTALDDNGKSAGTLVLTESSRTRLMTGTVSGSSRQYVTHSSSGTTPNASGQNSWTLQWRAPAASVGKVTFYVAGNAANGNGQDTGDFIYTTSASLAAYTAPAAVATVSAASFTQGSLAAETIAALYGAGLATNTVSATTLPLPTTLDGVTVAVKDAAGVERNASLFFVSSGQINLLLPSGTSNGAATITVNRAGTAVGAGSINIESVAPAFFAANSNGQGVPAALLFRVAANGTQSLEPIAQFNAATGQYEAIPLDLGAETDQVFLITYGTGFRYHSATAPTATIGGTAAEVLYAGVQGDLAGLDQANVRLPRTLAGRGLVNLVMTVDGKSSNTMQLSFK